MSYPKPLGKRLLVDGVNVERKTDKGILMPIMGFGDSIVGEVLDIGPEVSFISIGQIVHFVKHSSAVVPGPDGPLFIISEEAVLCTEEKDDLVIVSNDEAKKYEERRVPIIVPHRGGPTGAN